MRRTFLFVVALVLASRIAAADDKSPAVHVLGDSRACPSVEKIVVALNDSFTVHHADASAETDGIQVRVVDSGDHYRVTVGAQSRDFSDPARRCEDRVRAAAVLVVLLVEPPSLIPPATSPAPATSSAPAPRPTPAPAPAPPPPPVQQTESSANPAAVTSPTSNRQKLILQVGIAGILEGTPDSQGSVSGGAVVRVGVGVKHVSAVFGIGTVTGVDRKLSTATAHLGRTPLDLNLRGSLRFGRVELAGDVGVQMTLDQIDGEGLPVRYTGTRIEWGFRFAAETKIWFKERIAPYFGVQAEVFPVPIDLRIIDINQSVKSIGTTPRTWLGGFVGLAFRIL